MRLHQHLDGGPYVSRIGQRLPPFYRRVRVGGFVVLPSGLGNGQNDGPRASGAQHGEGPAQEFGHALRLVDVAVPFGHRLETGGEIEVRVLRAADRHAVGDAQHRRVVLVCLRQPRIGHLQPGSVHAALHRGHADLLTAGDARKGVRHGDGVAVVAHHEHGHVFAAERIVDPADGEGGDPLYALPLENPCNSGCDVGSQGSVLLCWELRVFHGARRPPRHG